MLEVTEIARSKLRKELLRLYFSNPEQEYYVRELERMLAFSAANLRRELVKLEQAGLFRSRRVANLVYYGLNKNSPIYSELKSIVFKTIGIEGSLRKIIESTKGIETALIYGSFAAGKETASSDIDLLVIGKPDEDKFMTAVNRLEKELGREVNYTVYSASEYEKRKDKRDSFTENILKRPKIMLKGTELGP